MARIGHIPKSQLYAGSGYNHFDPRPRARQSDKETSILETAAASNAAEALRAVDVEAGSPDALDELPDSHSGKLDELSIDELRVVAGLLDVRDREQITNRAELIAAIETHAVVRP